AILYDTPVDKGYAMREALLHLVFPDTFEDIIAREHKKAIANAFPEADDDPGADVDHRLLAIRRKLAPGRPGWFSFYDIDLSARWRDSADDRQRWDAFIDWGRRFV